MLHNRILDKLECVNWKKKQKKQNRAVFELVFEFSPPPRVKLYPNQRKCLKMAVLKPF